jgi:large subunit ribosomal protein L31
MKKGIHPTYYSDALIVCGTCGTQYRIGSVKKELHVDICSNCHPFYTGEQRIVDTAGQVERFMKRAAAKEQLAKPVESKKARRRAARKPVEVEAEAEPVKAPEAASEAKAEETAKAST